MPVPNPVPTASRRLAPWLALLVAGGLAACMESAATTSPDGGQTAAGAQTLDQKAASRPGVPDGCTREWSSAKRDSVLYCPDLLPPSPR